MNRRKFYLVIMPIILFAMLSICVQAGITVNFEGWAYNEAIERMSPSFTNIIKFITHIGDSTYVISFCLLLLLIPKSRRTIALPVSMTVITSFILNIALKNTFTRERPDILRLINETSYSFPSGHAMINSVLYVMLIMLIYKYVKNVPRRIALSAVCLALVIAIGYSRIYLGVHYAGDILGGWLFGFSISCFVYSIWNDKLSNRKTISSNNHGSIKGKKG